MRHLISGAGLSLALLILSWPSIAHAAKTDVLTLRNGDRITGDVKWLSRGKLEYSTDDAGRLAVEWVKVVRLVSPHSFEVKMSSGAKYYGRLIAIDRDGVLAVGGVAVDTLDIPSVVQIDVLDAGLFKRVRAYLDLGFNYAKANKAKTFSTSGQMAYRGDRYGSTITFDSYAQGQTSVPTTTRNSAGIQVTRYLPKRWSAVVLAKTEQNDELNLDLRVTGAAVLARDLIHSNQSELTTGVGLAVTRERFSPAAEDSSADGDARTNLEALLALTWDAFRFDSPKLDFSNSLTLYPSLTTGNRIRGEFTTRLKYELFADFDVGINFTDTFDSRPPDENATKNDFITAFTIGWSYRR